MKHASLQTFGPGNIPRGELHHLVQIGTASQAGEREPTSGPFVPVEAPERGRAALEDLDVDGVLTWRPLRDAHQSHGGGEPTGVRRDAVEHRLPRPHGGTTLPDHASLLRHGHAAEVTERLEAHLLQGLLIRKPEQDGNKTRNCAPTQ